MLQVSAVFHYNLQVFFLSEVSDEGGVVADICLSRLFGFIVIVNVVDCDVSDYLVGAHVCISSSFEIWFWFRPLALNKFWQEAPHILSLGHGGTLGGITSRDTDGPFLEHSLSHF